MEEYTNKEKTSALRLIQDLYINALVKTGKLANARKFLEEKVASIEQLPLEDISVIDLIGLLSEVSEWDTLIDICLKENDVVSALCYSDNARSQVLNRISHALKLPDEKRLPQEIKEKYKNLSEAWLPAHKMADFDTDAYMQQNRIKPHLEETVRIIQRWRGHWAANASPQKWSLDQHVNLMFMDRRTAIVEFWCHRNSSFAFLFMPDNLCEVTAVSLPNGHYNNLIRWTISWYEHYGRFESEGIKVLPAWISIMKDVCRNIGHAYWMPLLKHLTKQQIERVIVIPDQQMNLLPMHLGDIGSQDSPLFMCDQYEISIVPSLSLLKWAREREGPVCSPMLFAGNPIERCPKDNGCERCTLPLPLTEKQIEAIKTNWTDIHWLVGADCSSNKILETVHKTSPRIIHLATHGKTFFEDPLGSGLLVHLDKDSWKDPFSSYFDHELNPCWIDRAVGNILDIDTVIRNMKLDKCRLVVLSACEVGLHQLHASRESLSVASGFFAAGAPSVIAPLWPVTEFAAQLLFDKFYELLKKEPRQKAQALRNAQLWLRDLPIDKVRTMISEEDLKGAIFLSGEQYPFSNIFLWGPFQFMGSPI